MPLPYTPTTYKQFLITSLGETATFFDWSLSSPALDEVVNDVLLALGIDDLADAANFKQLRATGKYYVLLTALNHALTFYKFEVHGRMFERHKIVDNLRAALTIMAGDPNVVIDTDEDNNGFIISVTKIHHTDDPYSNERSSSYLTRPADNEL